VYSELGQELHLVFEQGGERYALSIEGVQEVLEPMPLGFVPQAPKPCLGVLAHHGLVVAVLDASVVFDESGAKGGPARGKGPLTRFILVSYGDYRFALQVDRIDRIGPLQSAFQPAGGTTGQGGTRWVEGVYPEPDGIVNKVSLEALAEEIDRLFQQPS